MHPCCWPAMIQSFLQAIPFLAIFAVGMKKVWDLFPKTSKTQIKEAPSCCSAAKTCHEPDKKNEIPITPIN